MDRKHKRFIVEKQKNNYYAYDTSLYGFTDMFTPGGKQREVYLARKNWYYKVSGINEADYDGSRDYCILHKEKLNIVDEFDTLDELQEKYMLSEVPEYFKDPEYDIEGCPEIICLELKNPTLSKKEKSKIIKELEKSLKKLDKEINDFRMVITKDDADEFYDLVDKWTELNNKIEELKLDK